MQALPRLLPIGTSFPSSLCCPSSSRGQDERSAELLYHLKSYGEIARLVLGYDWTRKSPVLTAQVTKGSTAKGGMMNALTAQITKAWSATGGMKNALWSLRDLRNGGDYDTRARRQECSGTLQRVCCKKEMMRSPWQEREVQCRTSGQRARSGGASRTTLHARPRLRGFAVAQPSSSSRSTISLRSYDRV